MVERHSVGFGEIADFLPTDSTSNGLPEQLCVSAGLVHDAEKHFDNGRFAGAIGSEQSENFSRLYLKRHPSNRFDLLLTEEAVTVSLCQVVDFYVAGIGQFGLEVWFGARQLNTDSDEQVHCLANFFKVAVQLH